MGTPLPPPRIQGLEFVRVLGQGGQAQVFQYAQEMPYRQVAVKVLTDQLRPGENRQEFFSEANLMASLEHPFIVGVYFAGITEDGRPYLVMQYYPRASLAERVRHERLRVDEVLRIGVQIGSAVETAHQAGILHRDIKPANILSDQYGAPALSDFGIASQMGRAGAVTSFSAPWAPPEVLAEQGRASVAADVYSLGATLWHLLVGRPPFSRGPGDTLSGLAQRILNEPPPTTGRPDVPRSLESLVQAMLAKDPALRPPSAVAVVRSLGAIERELGLPLTEVVLPNAPRGRPAPTVAEADATRVRPAAASVMAAGATVLRPGPPVPVVVPPSYGTPGMGRVPAWVWALAGVATVVVVAVVALALGRSWSLAATTSPAVTTTAPAATTTVTASAAPVTVQPESTSAAEPNSKPTFRVIHTITTMHAADGLALDARANLLYCANWGSGVVTASDLGSREVVHRIPAGAGSAGLALDPDQGRLFVSNTKSGDVAVFDTDDVARHDYEPIARLIVGDGAGGIELDTDAGRLYVSRKTAITVFDSQTLDRIDVIEGIASPRGMAIDQRSGLLYVANSNGDSVTLVDPVSLQRVGSIPVGTKPVGVTLDAASRRLYVANSGSDTLSVVDLDSRRVSTVPVGDEPMRAAVDATRGLVYVTNLKSDSLSVVDAESLEQIAEPSVGDAPEVPLVDPATHLVYVSNWYDGNVAVVEGS